MKARFEKMAKLIVVSCVATLALSTVAAAQTSDQVLRLWVGFNTLRNSKAVDPATKSEVDALDKKAIAANAAGNYGAAMDDYYHAIALLNGQAWTASRAVSFALNIDLSHALLEPGQTVSVTVKENYKPDLSPPGPLAGNLTLLDQKGDQAASLGSAPNANPDLKSHPLTLTAAIPAVADGNYRLHFVLTPASGDPITKDADIRVEKGLLKRAMEVSDEAQSLYSKLKAAHKSDLADALETVRYHIELCKLADAQKLNPSKVNFDAEIAKSEEELRALESGKDPFSLQHGDFRRAYLSKVDDTLQPYRIYVPIAYDASRPYPLIIALHGMGGDENTWFDLYGNGLFKKLAEKHGYIVACPKGRGPASMYKGPAEQDVLDVLAEVKRNYKIDSNRIYLTGHSMGGFGTWSIAVDHPDIFAALAPISGGGDPKTMAKIANIPELVTHGNADKTVPVQRSEEMVEAGKKAGAEIKYVEVPGGSHVSVAVPAFEGIFEFFDSHGKNNESAARANGASNK